MSIELVDVFQFMALRPAERLNRAESRKKFIRDDDYYYFRGNTSEPLSRVRSRPVGISDVDLFSSNSFSEIGKTVFAEIVKKGNKQNRVSEIIKIVEDLLTQGFGYQITGQSDLLKRPAIIKTVYLNEEVKAAEGMLLGAAFDKRTYQQNNLLYILPDQFADLITPITQELVVALRYIQDLKQAGKNDSTANSFVVASFSKKLCAHFNWTNSATPLADFVFSLKDGIYKFKFAFTKRILFDCLYGLYILRKKQSVSLEFVIDGLRVCHFLEQAAIAEYFQLAIKSKDYPKNTEKFLTVLKAEYPLLKNWNPQSPTAKEDLQAAGISLLESYHDIEVLLNATPIIHPIFAQLTNFFKPFNSLTPIGVGDLKVVKQKFLGYKKGEIAHIETVLAGETKTRVHRLLEKAEDSFSFSSATDSESTKDSQNTQRFELKKEAEETIKNDLNVNANATFTYKGNPVIDATVTAGMTYANSKGSSDKTSQNFVNEVVAKATAKVQSKVAQQRNQTRLVETEETNTHAFNNPAANGNISGIYQWLEKVYEGQIHNYGKRLMFEFMLPEPAEFFVESRLYAYTASLDLPQYPENKDNSDAGTPPKMPVSKPEEITEELFNNTLSKNYSLGDLLPPPSTIADIHVRNESDGGSNFIKKRAYNDTGLLKESYDCSISDLPTGYSLSGLKVKGLVNFRAKGEREPKWQNTLQILLNTQIVFDKVDETESSWLLAEDSILPMPSLNANTFIIEIGTKTCDTHTLQFDLTFQRSPETFAKWQNAVFERIKNSTPTAPKSSKPNEQELSAYMKQLAEIKATVLNEIIQGKSSAWNEELVKRELKRQCISMIAKEFDAYRADDIVSNIDAAKKTGIDVYFPVFEVSPGSSKAPKKPTSAKFADKKDDPLETFTFPDLKNSREKGKYIQFLEQAFEWNQQSHIFYPYFWARPPKWIELMSREDTTDPRFTDFLQAGSAKVLLAVKPGYENAVLHFLATREPWEGGPSPVIGDPLYIPLYEEIRSQQDDLAGSTPVGEPWIFTLPTSLIYLESDNYPLVNEYIPPHRN